MGGERSEVGGQRSGVGEPILRPRSPSETMFGSYWAERVLADPRLGECERQITLTAAGLRQLERAAFERGVVHAECTRRWLAYQLPDPEHVLCDVSSHNS